jgi:acylphosphatase
MSERLARRLVVHGRVQGVFFRAETRRRARRHDVHGWVANRPDGTVEAWLEGVTDAVDAVESWIRAGGPAYASVERVEAESVAPADHDGFEVRA